MAERARLLELSWLYGMMCNCKEGGGNDLCNRAERQSWNEGNKDLHINQRKTKRVSECSSAGNGDAAETPWSRQSVAMESPRRRHVLSVNCKQTLKQTKTNRPSSKMLNRQMTASPTQFDYEPLLTESIIASLDGPVNTIPYIILSWPTIVNKQLRTAMPYLVDSVMTAEEANRNRNPNPNPPKPRPIETNCLEILQKRRPTRI